MANLNALTKAELIAEIRRLKGKPEPKPRLVKVALRRPKRERAVVAGMKLKKDDLLVVDEETRLAYVHPEVKTVPDKIRIHGYAARSYKKGERVKIRPWWDYEPR